MCVYVCISNTAVAADGGFKLNYPLGGNLSLSLYLRTRRTAPPFRPFPSLCEGNFNDYNINYTTSTAVIVRRYYERAHIFANQKGFVLFSSVVRSEYFDSERG